MSIAFAEAFTTSIVLIDTSRINELPGETFRSLIFQCDSEVASLFLIGGNLLNLVLPSPVIVLQKVALKAKPTAN